MGDLDFSPPLIDRAECDNNQLPEKTRNKAIPRTKDAQQRQLLLVSSELPTREAHKMACNCSGERN